MIIKEVIRVPVIEEERAKYYNMVQNPDILSNFELRKNHYKNVQIAYGVNKYEAQKKADKLFNDIFKLEIKSRMGW